MLLKLGTQKMIILVLGLMGLLSLGTVNTSDDENVVVSSDNTAPTESVTKAITIRGRDTNVPAINVVLDQPSGEAKTDATTTLPDTTTKELASDPQTSADATTEAAKDTPSLDTLSTTKALLSSSEAREEQASTTASVDAEDPFAQESKEFPTLPAETTVKAAYTIDPALAAMYKGVEILPELGIPLPKKKFEYDASPEAKAARYDENFKKFMEEPDSSPDFAKLKAQMKERELMSKAKRADHLFKRTIVRLIQEARLEKDAKAAERRLKMEELKQKQLESERKLAEEELREQRKEQEKQREAREKKAEEERKKVEERNEKMRKLREEEVKRQNEENELRRKEEKEDKKKGIAEREERLAKEKEDKRKMIEKFQAMQADAMEREKKMAQEDRLLEAKEAQEAMAARKNLAKEA
eukprot:m.70241 g.70241  ORF g.70241 m.70241 type:complete len:413 (-) comp10004_c0_seq1:102-1340(-)